ncbi:nuclear transport factor 2 family protein [Gracilimonas tropica]|uniref:nuclear transport factor 2 family protein n=1 Tax=Gracilimonas tropica TaxID=454600 RepID=UPI00036A2F9B|nr:nuclear transport factor 2 family protein [Gracilimonas tropica]
MKKPFLLFSILTVGLALSASIFNPESSDTEAIKKVLLTGYVHGAFNELDPEAMANTFHKDFAIFSAKGEEISRYPISSWIESTKKRKNNPNFDPKKNVWDPKFVNISVTGNAASVTLELYHRDKHIYTDYLSLLKFDSGWKVVAKVYHQHS